MLYPLYDYYKKSSLTLDEIVDHYVTRFYARKHNGKDVLKVLTKVKESSKIKNLCGESATRRIAPNYVDFASVINEILFFMFKSNMTQALAVLFAALYWDERINSVYHLKSAEDLKDDIIKIFKKYSICEEMTESEFFGNKNENLQESPSSYVSNINGKQETVNVKSDEKTSKEKSPNKNTNNTNNTTWGLRDYYDFNESFKKHVITFGILRRGVEFCYFSSKNESSPLWTYVIKDKENLNEECPIGAEPLAWILKHYDNQEDFCWLLEVLDELIAHLWADALEAPEKLIKDIQKYVPSFKLGNDPQRLKTNIGWSWIDIHAILNFIDYCKEFQNQPVAKPEDVKSLQECSTLEDLASLYWSDYNKEHHSRNGNNMGEDSKAEDSLKDSKIVCSWSLLDFAKKHGKMQLGEFTNKNTGEQFKSCLFTNPDDGTRTFVAFSTSLGVLTPKEISAMKHELSVVQLSSGNYYLCKQLIADTVELEDEKNLSTKVTEDDWANAWTDDYGVQYSKDRKKLLRAPYTLEEYTVLNGTIIICDSSFYGHNNLKSIFFPSTVKKIGELAFYCTGLNELTLPDSVLEVKNGAFCECRELFTITLNDGLRIIGEHAFAGYKKINSIKIPDSVTSIGKEAFWNCCFLEHVNIPRNINKIGEGVFSYCCRLSGIIVDKDNCTYDSRNNCNAIIETSSNTLVSGCYSTKIPDSVIRIGKLAFMGCVFNNIAIPYGVLEIGDRAFANCYNLGSIKIPTSVKKIGNRAFLDCKQLASMLLPESVNEIGDGVLSGCQGMTSIIINEKNRSYDSRNGCNAIIDTKHNRLIAGCSTTIIPQDVQIIGGYAFADCKLLSTISIPKSVIFIEESAFSGCEGLSNITLPSNLEEIGKAAFWGCKNLSSIEIPNSCKRIEESAFNQCTKLTSIIIPNGTRSVYEELLPDYKERLIEKTKTDEDPHVADDNWWADEKGIPYIIDYMPNVDEEIDEQAGTGALQREASSSIVQIPDMIKFGLEWRNQYFLRYAIKDNNKVRAEVLMYTCWSVWYHCLNNDRVSRNPGYANNFFAHLMAHLQDNDSRFEDVDFFMPLFKNRYQIYRTDLKGLAESHYPVTKQYIPMCTYKAFCTEQLKIVYPSSISSLLFEEDEEMMEFVGKFIEFTNEMQKAINRTF